MYHTLKPDYPDRQRLKGFVLRAGKVIIIVSIFLSAFNSFSERENRR